MPIELVLTRAGFVEYNDNPQQNRKDIQDQGKRHFAMVSQIRSEIPGVADDMVDWDQPSAAADKIALQIMLKCIIHYEKYGAAENDSEKRRMLHNLFMATALLSKTRNHSLPKLYKVDASRGKYGYNIWEAMEFMLANFQIYDGAYPGLPLLTQKTVDALLGSQAVLKEIILTELGNDNALKSQVREEHSCDPHLRFPTIFCHVSIFKDIKVIKKLFALLNTAELEALKWAQLSDRVALMGIASQVGEFIQSQHLSLYSRAKFDSEDLRAFQELRTQIEHSTAVLTKVFSSNSTERFQVDELNNLRVALIDFQQRLPAIYDSLTAIPDLDSVALAGLKGFVKEHYEDGTLQPGLNIFPAASTIDTDLSHVIQRFSQDNFLFKCTETPNAARKRFQDEILKAPTTPQKQKNALRVAIRGAKEMFKVKSIASYAGIGHIKQLLVTPKIEIVPTHIGQVYLALLACLTRLPGYQAHFAARVQSFAESTPVMHVPNTVEYQSACPILWQAITNNTDYQDLMKELWLLEPSLNGVYIVRFPAGEQLPAALDSLRGTPAPVDCHSLSMMNSQESCKHALSDTYHYLHFQIMSAQMRGSFVALHSTKYLLKLLEDFFSKAQKNGKLKDVVPEAIRPELNAMGNVFAHSSAMVDMQPQRNAGFLVRYASIFIHDIVGNGGVAQQIGPPSATIM